MPFAPFGSIEYSTIAPSTHGPMRFRPNNRIQIDWHTDSRTQAAFCAHNFKHIETSRRIYRNEKRLSNWKHSTTNYYKDQLYIYIYIRLVIYVNKKIRKWLI